MYSWLGVQYLAKKHVNLYISGNKFDGNLSDFLNTLSTSATTLESLDASDLSLNNLHGTIPPCVNNFTSMVRKGTFLEQNKRYSFQFFGDSYIDHLSIEWHGKINEFSSILGLLKVIAYVKANNLTMTNPYEVTKSAEIPPTMSQMTFLDNLDMSFNDLSGRIPLGTQLQTFNASRYIGNPGLCGRPLPKKCTGDEALGVPPVGESDGDGESTNELQRWFYIGGASGFATGFRIDM
ncbi:leucine-rich repeat-containing protein [Tanacetum coccineum]